MAYATMLLQIYAKNLNFINFIKGKVFFNNNYMHILQEKTHLQFLWDASEFLSLIRHLP